MRTPNVRYRGTLYVPGEMSREGLPVHVLLTDRHIELVAGDESLGRYPLREATAERIAGDRFDLVLAGDRVVFEAEDAIAFSYEAIPHISSARLPMVSDRVRRWWVSRGDGFDDEVPAAPAPAPVSPISRITDRPLPSESTEGLMPFSPPQPAPLRVLDEPDPPGPELDEPVIAVRSVREALGEAPTVCRGLRADGELCGSTDLGPRGFCSVHDPDRIAERRLARERLEAAAVVATSHEIGAGLANIVARLEKAVVEVHEGVLEADRASAMAALVEAMCQALDRSN
jgi:hypothetical protein